MALPLSAGRMMMFSFCWRDFKDCDCFPVMFLLGGFALRMIEPRSARMMSASSVVIPVNVVSILATKSVVGRVALPASGSNFQHSRPFLAFHLFPFPFSPWCWKLALPAFGRFSVEHVRRNT